MELISNCCVFEARSRYSLPANCPQTLLLPLRQGVFFWNGADGSLLFLVRGDEMAHSRIALGVTCRTCRHEAIVSF